MSADIPAPILDAALAWAVALNSGTADAAQHRSFERWLAADAQHRAVWERLQMIDAEFAPVRSLRARGTQALAKAAQRSRAPRIGLGSVASVLLLAAVSIAALVVGDAQPRIWLAEHRTGGEQRLIALAGGASVRLNRDTALDIETDGEAGVPLIRLYRGEILVDSSAAAPADKPRVRTAQALLTPLGTRFEVRESARGSELAVLAGSVRLQAQTAVEVAAGERWQIRDGIAQPLAPTGIAPAGWVDNIVEADNAQLGAVLAALAAQHSTGLHYDAEVAALRVTGVFRLDDTDGALRALAKTLPVRIEHRADGTYLRASRPPPLPAK